MTHLFEPPSHSEYIARWRLYLWIRFLETGDDSQFIIPKDKKMAKKAKDKINRMEVMWYVESLFPATGYPQIHPVDKSSLCDITSALLRRDDRTYKPNEQVQVNDMACYKQLMKDVESPIKFTSYSYVNHSNEIKVESNNGQPAFNGADILKLFNGKVRFYDGKPVIARKDPSGYCCLYFQNKKGNPTPIQGVDAKIIGAAILADLAVQQLNQSESEEVHLVQGYTWEGKKGDIAEYYSKQAKTQRFAKDRSLETPRETIIKAILSPLDSLIKEYRSNPESTIDQRLLPNIITLRDLLAKEMADETSLKEHIKKHKENVKLYAKAIKGKYDVINAPGSYRNISRRGWRLNEKTSVSQFFIIMNTEPNLTNIYNIKNNDTNEVLIEKNIGIIKKNIIAFNEYLKNRRIKIILHDDYIATTETKNYIMHNNKKYIANIEENDNINSIPNYMLISSDDNECLSLRPTANEFGKFNLPIDNRGEINQSSEISSSWHTIDKQNLPSSNVNLALDMSGFFELSTCRGRKIIFGSHARGVSPEDVDLISKDIFREISEGIPEAIKCRIDTLTLRKLSYICLQAHLHQSGIQLSTLSILAMNANFRQNISTVVDQDIKKFMSAFTDENGVISVKLTTILKIIGQHDDPLVRSYINESIALETELKVDITQHNPVFIMNQTAELKNVPELRPEHFFNEKPKPKPSLLGRYFGYRY